MCTEEIISKALVGLLKSEQLLGQVETPDIHLSFILADVVAVRSKLERVVKFYNELN